VEVTGVPAGWTAATTTLGTFVGRERCPRGGGHDGGEGGHDGGEGGHDGGEGGHDGGEGGHDGDVGVLAADGGDDGHGGGPRDCVHAVVLVQDPAPPPAEPPAEPPVGPPGPVVAAGSLTPAASTATTAGASTAATPGASTAASGAVLPETGAPSVPLAGVGVALLGLGGLLSGWSRRRRALVTARARSMERARALAAVRPIP
jgi:LPXTG-motif cell wall-anchored protein